MTETTSRTFRRVMLRATIAAGAAVTALLVLWPGDARANYTVQECVLADPVARFAPDVWPTGSGNRKIFQRNECGPERNWGVALQANGLTQPSAWSGWYVSAAPGTTFKVAKAKLHYLTGNGYGPLSDATGGLINTGPAGNQYTTITRNDTPYLGILLWCFSQGGCQSPGGQPDPKGPFVYASDYYFEVQDHYAPSVRATGELLDGAVARGIESLQVGAADIGGGVRSISISVNGTASAASGNLCPPNGVAGSYASVRPCAGSTSVPFAIDTQKDPGWVDGPNDVRICSTDIAGNGSACLQRTVVVDNSCPASGGATPATSLDTGVEVSGQLRDTAAVSSNTSPIVRGALRNGAGNPVSGATVCVYETVDLPDGSRQLAQVATTQGNGRFATRLDAGPSRDLDVVYRYNSETLAQELDLNSTVVPTLKIADKSLVNGDSARFRGSVPGPNAESRVITLQAKAGKKWRTFKQLRTNSVGSFKGRYRFTQTTGEVRYTFRAVVKRQGGYPYEPGSSRKRKVLVRG